MQTQMRAPVRTARPAFSGVRPVVLRAPVAQRQVAAQALHESSVPYGIWPNPDFVKDTLAAFPEKGLATVEEARCLFPNGGFVWLDVRSELEVEEVGKVKGSVNVPWVILKRVYNPETRQKEMKKEPNPNFTKLMEKKFPDKNTKLLVACSNGTAYSYDALEALEEAGYTNLSFVKGGFNFWFRTFDNKFARRNYGEYQETYNHSGDSCGIHASGAGFDKVDKVDRWSLPVY